MMIQLVTVIAAFILPLTISAQCQKEWEKSDPKDKMAFYEREFSTETMDALKKTTTVFFYRDLDSAEVSRFREAFSEAWNITPIILDNGRNFEKYAGNPNYSYFTNGGYQLFGSVGRVSYSYTHNYLLLQIGGRNDNLYRIELYPRITSTFGIDGTPEMSRIAFYGFYYFFNWNPISLKAHLLVAASSLAQNKRPCLYEKVRDQNLAGLLAADTLYVPKDVLNDFRGLGYKQNYVGDDLFKAYQFPYRLCTNDELYQIFQVEKRGRFLFENVISETFKYITIFDVKDKKVVYKTMVESSRELRAKDLKKIK